MRTHQEDNGRWCLPGGGMVGGGSAAETCVIEVLDETGLEVRVTKPVDVYTTLGLLIEYLDANKIHGSSSMTLFPSSCDYVLSTRIQESFRDRAFRDEASAGWNPELVRKVKLSTCCLRISNPRRPSGGIFELT